MKQFLAITGALADSNRVRALAACLCGELCVCQIIELLGLAPSTVSKHLSILKQAGLLESRKAGKWMYYRTPGQEIPAMVRQALDFVRRSLDDDKQIAADIRILKKIVKMNPEELCERQRTESGCCSSAPAIPVEVRWPKVGRGTSKVK